ncbi:MAG: threonylcarbamoyl-AMP synthase [Oscillospiraceae bacterium]|nr:threonylcarbamoyl-AMP synthase [Oscillospiraceae bacterium]
MNQISTKLLHDSPEDLRIASELLRNGELVAIPTETVYGLGADARNETAVRAIFAAKGRPADNPLIVHIADLDMLGQIASEIPEIAIRLAEQFWAGALTMILKKRPEIPSVTSGGLDTVGIRMPSHPLAREIIRLSGCPIAAPSANRSGLPSPTTAKHVLDDMDGRIAAVVDGGQCEVGVESTVICFDDPETIHILRPGCISLEDLQPFAEKIYIDKAIFEQISPDAKVASPGMKYKHYSPETKILPVDAPDFESFSDYVKSHVQNGTYCLLFNSDPDISGIPCMRYGDTGLAQAHDLFLRFRELDEVGAQLAYVRMPRQTGADLSVYNRLMRAAGFEVIKL